LLLCGLALQGFVHLRLYPQILAVKSQVASFESAPESEARTRFRALHGVSMALNVLSVANGALLLALVPLAASAVTETRTLSSFGNRVS
jgi:hypothetical protein